MSVEEGLKSTDVEIIKSARGSAKGKVSKNVKALGNVLIRDGGTFLLDEIDHDRAAFTRIRVLPDHFFVIGNKIKIRIIAIK